MRQKRRVRLDRLVVSFVAAVTLAACGVPRQDHATIVHDARLVTPSTSTSLPPAASGGR